MSWSTVRDGIKTRLDTISGLSGRDTAPDALPDKDTATVLPGDPVIMANGHAGKVEVRAIVRVRCVRGKLQDSQDALDAYIWPTGANSIIAAVNSGRRLPASATPTVDDVEFIGVTNYGGVEGTAGVQADINFRALVTA